ncbi:hypothetical protein BU24DRAFT_451561 [Aaosphaeria arxii CBS 175.79]|uniref:Integral membrane protein n=1 Tax=Aaosphaeria arxii CBS 175.79 TaxID=1450172 RepID=A0A6A5XP62_9PLEO|nr:uncharacterized protein BU24DRAFT_451561 [Aaosphaeria arxii CBS 175.79]KAF2014551.1 hypothetical protein BU24DRAFT_451561 [Aaosphaeria arxii CBS 175.79]
MGLSDEFDNDPNFKPFGPFIPHDYVVERIRTRTVIIGCTIFAVSTIFTLSAAYIGVLQTRRIRKPWRSAYIWMIWLENIASTAISILCILHLFKIIRPSFYFYFFLLVLWAFQVQLLLQIIINRIRVILPNRRKGFIIMYSVALIVSCIIISVFCIWVPARLQISRRYERINNVWDRIEKVLYLIIDAALNFYFIRVVRANLVRNGLQKYNKLVRMNEKLIVISLLMDVMIIAAMSIPNGLLYASFHPLAYLVKLNIEMIMANLIRKVALKSAYDADFYYEFGTATDSSGSRPNSAIISSEVENPPSRRRSLLQSLTMWIPRGNEIKKTEEYSVRSEVRDDLELQGKVRPSGDTFGNRSEIHPVARTKTKDSSRWTDGIDLTTGFSKYSRETGTSGPSEYDSQNVDEETGLVKPSATYAG